MQNSLRGNLSLLEQIFPIRSSSHLVMFCFADSDFFFAESEILAMMGITTRFLQLKSSLLTYRKAFSRVMFWKTAVKWRWAHFFRVQRKIIARVDVRNLFICKPIDS